MSTPMAIVARRWSAPSTPEHPVGQDAQYDAELTPGGQDDEPLVHRRTLSRTAPVLTRFFYPKPNRHETCALTQRIWDVVVFVGDVRCAAVATGSSRTPSPNDRSSA